MIETNKKSSLPFRPITAVVANEKGEIFDLAGYAAVGCDGPVQACLCVEETRNLPHGSELMYLPDRVPLVYDLQSNAVVAMAENPYEPGEAIFPVAAFNSPGYVITHTGAWEERSRAVPLPLFSYGAVGWHRGKFRSAVLQVDKEPRQDLRRMPADKVAAGVQDLRQTLAGNRLSAHLENCALNYGCPAGKNFFLGRYEAPLPTATTCNAGCLGCLSLQSDKAISCSQERIAFTPSPEEIAQVAMTHIKRVKQAVVSFGQGCEGDPLMAADTITRAIRKIRSQTDQGTINMNTNGSLPDKIEALLDAGLDSLRISMNSLRKVCYTAYFRPRGYGFGDVLESIDLALQAGAHVAINYLNCPGFNDTPEEGAALMDFIDQHPISMIQWRNLNFDPLRYLLAMNRAARHSRPTGVRRLLDGTKKAFPHLRFGYFNPPKEKFTHVRHPAGLN
ncbi:MAG: radical SAM protein [Desulfobacteraceae bacterium]